MVEDPSPGIPSNDQPSTVDRMSFAQKLLSAAAGQWGHSDQSNLMGILRGSSIPSQATQGLATHPHAAPEFQAADPTSPPCASAPGPVAPSLTPYP